MAAKYPDEEPGYKDGITDISTKTEANPEINRKHEEIESKQLTHIRLMNVASAESKGAVPICRELCGLRVFKEFVGPENSNLIKFQSDLNKQFPKSIAVVDANRDLNKLTIFSNETTTTDLVYVLETALNDIKVKFQAEEREMQLGSEFAVRANIRKGGRTEVILMPDEYRTVKIIRKNTDVTDDKIIKRFRRYGDIKKYTKHEGKYLWGYITYFMTESAFNAVKKTTGGVDFYAKPNVSLVKNGLNTKIVWCRRPFKGDGFIKFKTMDNKLRAIVLGVLTVDNRCCRVTADITSEHSTSVHISGFDESLTKEDLRHSVAEALEIDPTVDIENVTLLRKKVITSPENVDTFHRYLSQEITKYAPTEDFDLKLLQPEDSRKYFLGYCRFSNPEEGREACTKISQGFMMYKQPVSMTPLFNIKMYVRETIFNKCEEEIKDCIKDMKDVNATYSSPKGQCIIVELQYEGEKEDILEEARKAILEKIHGHVIDCKDHWKTKGLFSSSGWTKMQSIMNDTKTVIIMDDQAMTISIHGSSENRQEACKQVETYLQDLANGIIKELELKGIKKPPGVMKSLIQRFGSDLNELQTKTGVAIIKRDYKSHRLTLVGSGGAIDQAVNLINDIIENLPSQNINEENTPECVICFTPVETYDIYRVECCGHVYCKDCVRHQLEVSIASKDFPIVCGKDNCGAPFCWQDIDSLCDFGFVDLPKFVTSSVGAFVAQHKQEFHYCITPNCPIVYRITQRGYSFLCPECNAKICTGCHAVFHEGLSCAKYKAIEEVDPSMTKWFSEDKRNRKQCPSCKIAIEKGGGCQHVQCTECKKHICWICCQFFENFIDYDRHLSEKHRGYVQNS